MILILKPDINTNSETFRSLETFLENLPNIRHRVHQETGAQQLLTEVYLVGDTAALAIEDMQSLPGVERVVRVSEEYRVLGRHKDDRRPTWFDYNGVRFGQDTLHVFAGLCAVNTREHVEAMMKALQSHGQVCTRMGAYKPRTSPYSFQGHGKACLPYVFELAGKYGIKVVAMEITHEDHVDEIVEALEQTGNPTGVILQIGTRNTQNFELLKSVGRQKRFPVLLKRGFGITLEESLNAAEYLASEGNRNVVFALRGMKTNMGDPHRNLVDFAHVPVVKRLTRMPVCIDPSHSVGTRDMAPDGMLDVMHVTAQGVIAGANMILVDFHPDPASALVDGPQALTLDELPWYLDDVQIAREAYLKRQQRAEAAGSPGVPG
ncbi:3-deoxy-D-arabinoheptulosonate-7-phosphate synthase [Thiogranum longum]|uniref:3-deoxy-D-arabinoheptulosonate-7-phosphate synthase n=1 Tax=Thiogranum longum TaxID=1537524 RepID=A0A4R1HAL8_9GAMM|nr:3-deoxy-7-phosphoheptulonate synthase [Thiogranum longum]TCK18378.1 3-deoxy-D-arabinoheptulosonate-7-phosphate synthase [Thiogranum longum]